jgi:hypothetical protein
MAFSFPSGNNTYVPVFDASGKLIVEYSRNPKDFALNEYVTIRPVKKSEGLYLKIRSRQAARVLSATGAPGQFIWNDGNDADRGEWNKEAFQYANYVTVRQNFPFSLGYKSVDQADWGVVAMQAAVVAQQAMTERTLFTLGVATTTGNYNSGQTDTAANWGGGFLNAGTPTNPIFKIALRKMAQKINKATLAVVKPKDLIFVVDPVTAAAIAEGQEVHTYLKENPVALEVLKGDGQFIQWGLPSQMYGYKIVVEDTVVNAVHEGVTDSLSYALSNKAFMVARPGSLVSPSGGANFSSLQMFMYEEMTVEQKDDPDNRRINGRVVEDYDVRMAAPDSACLCTNTLS